MSSTSPDGKCMAYAVDRYAWWIDGPDQSLYLETPDSKKTVYLMSLGQDAFSISEIVWSDDSSLVGFLISRQRLKIYERNGDEADYIDISTIHQSNAHNVSFSSDTLKIYYNIGCKPGEKVIRHEIPIRSR